MKTISSIALLLLFFYSDPNGTKPSVTDAEEVRIGEVLAKDFEQQEGIQPTPQSIKMDAYLQTVGDKVAANAQRKLPYRFHFDPSPAFRSAVALPGGRFTSERGFSRTSIRKTNSQPCSATKLNMLH